MRKISVLYRKLILSIWIISWISAHFWLILRHFTRNKFIKTSQFYAIDTRNWRFYLPRRPVIAEQVRKLRGLRSLRALRLRF